MVTDVEEIVMPPPAPKNKDPLVASLQAGEEIQPPPSPKNDDPLVALVPSPPAAPPKVMSMMHISLKVIDHGKSEVSNCLEGCFCVVHSLNTMLEVIKLKSRKFQRSECRNVLTSSSRGGDSRSQNYLSKGLFKPLYVLIPCPGFSHIC